MVSNRFVGPYSFLQWVQLSYEITTEVRKKAFQRFLEEWCDPLGMNQAPASTMHHNAKPGGLVDHMARVADIALAFQTLFPEVNRESIAICALLHDVAKLGILTPEGPQPRYLVNPQFKSNLPISKANMPYMYNPKLPDLSMTIWTAAIVAKWLPLSVDEWKAMTFHDGMYVPENIPMFQYHNAEPLVLLLHYADMMAGCIEKGVTFREHADLVMVGPSAETLQWKGHKSLIPPPLLPFQPPIQPSGPALPQKPSC